MTQSSFYHHAFVSCTSDKPCHLVPSSKRLAPFLKIINYCFLQFRRNEAIKILDAFLKSYTKKKAIQNNLIKEYEGKISILS